MIKLSEIVSLLRQSKGIMDRFNGRIGGITLLEKARENSYNLGENALFVIPRGTTSNDNNIETGIGQMIIERFGVVVAIANDTIQGDEDGMAAFDIVSTVRSEIFKAILGHDNVENETPLYFVNDEQLGSNRAWLWYLYEFEYQTRITRVYDPETNTTGDGKSFDISKFSPIGKIWADIILSPSKKLEKSKEKDLSLDSADADQQQLIKEE